MKRLMLAACVAVAMSCGLLPAMEAQAAGWEDEGDNDGVRVYSKEVEGSDVLAFKGVIVTDVHIGKLMSAFLDENQRSKWVDLYGAHKTLIKTDDSQTYWIHFKLPFPATDRDYVLKSDATFQEDKKIILVKIKSVTHPSAPENDCCVRAKAFGTYYKFEALDGGKTRITVEVHTDPMGLLPDVLINLIQEDWPSKTLNGLIKQARTQSTHPDFVAWH